MTDKNVNDTKISDYDLKANKGKDYSAQIFKVSYIKDMFENKDIQTAKQLEAVISNLVRVPTGKKVLGRLSIHETLKASVDIEGMIEEAVVKKSKESEITYEEIARLGYSGKIPDDMQSPAKEIIGNIKARILAERGFFHDEKGKLTFNVNIFLTYVLSRFKIVRTKGGQYYIYNNDRGFYEQKEETFISSLLRNVIHEGSENIWKPIYMREYLATLPLVVPNINYMNEDKNYINLENGMLDLKAMMLENHNPKHYSTIRIPSIYNPDAICPIFDKFLQEIMDGDIERIANIQEQLGYFLTGHTLAEKFFFWFGTGANGKSLLSRVAQLICGEENVVNVSIDNLGDKFGLARLPHKTLSISNENGRVTNNQSIQNMKAIASGDSLNINVKYQDGFDYAPICKLVFLMNDLPEISDNTEGASRKTHILPFNRTFKSSEQDKFLYNKLESEVEGILASALRGLTRLRKNNYIFTSSAACDEILGSYENDNNPVLEFIEDCLDEDPLESVDKKDVVEEFQMWAERNGRSDLAKKSPQEFWKLFKHALGKIDVLYGEKKVRGVRKIKGFQLKLEGESNECDHNEEQEDTVMNF